MSILRDLTLRIEPHLSSDDVLIVIGARQVGKTTLTRVFVGEKTFDKEVTFFDLESQPDLRRLQIKCDHTC